MFKVGFSQAVIASAIAEVSKYHINDKYYGIKQILVTTAKEAFWQKRPPLPKYCGTYNIRIVLRFIEKLGEKKICP